MTLYPRTLGLIIALLLATPSQAEDAAPKEEKKTIDVFAAPVATTDLYDPVVFGGRIESRIRADVGAEVEGRVRKIHVKLGQRVRAGDLLFSVRPTQSGFQNFRAVAPVSGICLLYTSPSPRDFG